MKEPSSNIKRAVWIAIHTIMLLGGAFFTFLLLLIDPYESWDLTKTYVESDTMLVLRLFGLILSAVNSVHAVIFGIMKKWVSLGYLSLAVINLSRLIFLFGIG